MKSTRENVEWEKREEQVPQNGVSAYCLLFKQPPQLVYQLEYVKR